MIEQVFEKLITWAVNTIETSSNQPILPHAIIVLNAAEHTNREGFWDSSSNTDDILKDISNIVDKNEMFSTWARFWRDRGKPIGTLQDLVLCYYSSIKIVRVPNEARPMLVHQQVTHLYDAILDVSQKAQKSRSHARMLLDFDELQKYMREAFGVFSREFKGSFDFAKSSSRNSSIPADFSGNISKLLLGAIEIWKDDPDIKPQAIFFELSWMIASCIMLDCSRRKEKGNSTLLIKK